MARVMTIIPKKTPESKRNEMFPLKRNEKNTIYINESGLYGLILCFKLESAHVFRFRVAKNLIVFWLLYKILKGMCINISMSIIKKVFHHKETELPVIKCKDDVWFRGKTIAGNLKVRKST